MPISLEVWGDYALFTRPEMKVERVSYDVMTPSDAAIRCAWHSGGNLLASGAAVGDLLHPRVRADPVHQSAAQ